MLQVNCVKCRITETHMDKNTPSMGNKNEAVRTKVRISLGNSEG